MDTTFEIQLTVAELKEEDEQAYEILIADGPFRFGWMEDNVYKRDPTTKVDCEAAVYAMAYQMARKGIVVDFIFIT